MLFSGRAETQEKGKKELIRQLEELTYPQSIYGILAILSMGPQSGYDIRKALDHPEMFYWRESYGNIYPMLKSLLKDGLVDKKDSYVKTKKRVFYELNQKGLDELQIWIKEPANLSRFRIELLMKLRFGISCGVDNMLDQISHYRKLSEEQLVEAELILNHISCSEDSLTSDLRKIAISLFTERKKAAISWCDNSMKTLAKWKGQEVEGHTVQNDDTYPQWMSLEASLQEYSSIVSVPPRFIPIME
jgi:PadR family transcriptional regulator AphA